ncbi:helix-turn-helix domain-containing protein [Burkholderia pyrrocinia]|uniref:helix-turn-helix domain-containing protein n=1 Tax=Burkholderia pyrrocinia TaxID=60550 RepID=UPI00158E939C|nr:helix-turn-helix domain-containing protein [Burkholderia pyrrocinia]
MEKVIEGVLVERVLYVYRCAACGHRGEVRHIDDSYDGAAATCAQCYGPVTLEWDGGVTLEATPSGPVAHPPTPAELVHLRTRHGRTQVAVAERLGVTPRQVQRWEAGVGAMPIASWQLLCREWGTRFREDFTTVPTPTWGWDAQRDDRRDTIERGDVVHLQAIAGPQIQATVCRDRVHDGLVDEHAYGAIVTGISASTAAGGPRLEGFVFGERVTFSRSNVIHLEQRAPHAPARSTGA